MFIVQESTSIPQALGHGRDIHPTETAVHRELTESAYGELRRLACQMKNGILTLTGNVDSFYLKQLAQTTARRATGECLIDNQIKVADGKSR